MSKLIPEDHYFYCLTFIGVGMVEPFGSVETETGAEEDFCLSAHSGPLAELEASPAWTMAREALHRLERSNLTILATSRTEKDVANAASSVQRAIWLHGSRHTSVGATLHGRNEQDCCHVSAVALLRPYPAWQEARPAELNVVLLQRAGRIACGIRQLWAGAQDRSDEPLEKASVQLGRFRTGLAVWWRGIEEHIVLPRLHQFVRALEAIVKPGPDNTRGRFVHRCATTFLDGSQPARALVARLWRLRCVSEHIGHWRDYEETRDLSEDDIRRLCYQAELLTGHVYQRILQDTKLLGFMDEDALCDFWSRPDDERRTLWGDALDIFALTKERTFAGLPGT